MTHISNISAVLFDMDGTLIDSEPLTEVVIRAFCRDCGVDDVSYRWSEFHGVNWEQVVARITADYPQLKPKRDAAAQLHKQWTRACAESPPPEVPGARDAVVAARAHMPTAIVSSSYREDIDATIRLLALDEYVTCRAGADDYVYSKPAPDGFLHAANVLGVSPRACLVFEDSLAGIQSAKAAGMPVVAITHRSNVAAQATELADRAIKDFTELDEGFFDQIKGVARSAG